MIFIGLAYEEEAVLNALSEAEWHALRDETLQYVEALRASGRLIDARPLQSARTASTVRVRAGRATVTDGPFAETKEQLGGFFLFDASSMEEARRIAEGWPSARLGSIEVRPLEDGLRLDSRYRR
ncbi:MAG: YciI family protein [Vicinamibacterales bacterium]